MATILREKFVALNKQNVGEVVGEVSVMEMSERQRKIVDLIKENPTISAAQMSVMLSVIKRTVERELSLLRKQGVIAREGSARNGRWLILKP